MMKNLNLLMDTTSPTPNNRQDKRLIEHCTARVRYFCQEVLNITSKLESEEVGQKTF